MFLSSTILQNKLVSNFLLTLWDSGKFLQPKVQLIWINIHLLIILYLNRVLLIIWGLHLMWNRRIWNISTILAHHHKKFGSWSTCGRHWFSATSITAPNSTFQANYQIWKGWKIFKKYIQRKSLLLNTWITGRGWKSWKCSHKKEGWSVTEPSMCGR